MNRVLSQEKSMHSNEKYAYITTLIITIKIIELRFNRETKI